MTPNEYQQLAMRTKADPAKILARLNELGPAYVQAWIASNGITNEGGEVSDILKASIEYGKGPVDVVHLTEEIGDALWRLAQLADAFGITFSECMDRNIAKLEARYPDKYTDELALNRNLEVERSVLEAPVRKGGPYPVFTECNEAGFIEPTEDNPVKIAPLTSRPANVPFNHKQEPIFEGWSYGRPTEPGDYEWFSPVNSLNPMEITIHRNYNGNIATWGRSVYYRKSSS